jgi:hypothetical protein
MKKIGYTYIMNIHQVYIGNEEGFSEALKTFGREIKTFQALGRSKYKLWTDKEIKSLLLSEYGPRAVLAYESFGSNTSASDLARAAIIDSYGGWYSDLGNQVINSDLFFLPEHVPFLFFHDTKIDDPFFQKYVNGRAAIQTGLFFSKSNSHFLKSIIKSIIENSENRFYGDSPWDPTGPVLFGKTFYDLKLENKYLGNFEKLNKENRFSYFINTEAPIAYFKHPEKSKIFKSPEVNYVTLWENKKFYK